MAAMTTYIAQIDPAKVQGDGTPPLTAEHSYGSTWIAIALLTALILFITFKTSKRNAQDRT